MYPFEFDRRPTIVDLHTPRNVFLSGRYKRSFAYRSLHNFFPVMLTDTINDLIKDKCEILLKHGEFARQELKTIVGQLSELKYQLETNKTFENISGNAPDCDLWNNFINGLTIDVNSFYFAPWLYAQCYIYRKMASFFWNSSIFKDYDYFSKKKVLNLNKNCIFDIAQKLRRADGELKTFQSILKLNLWNYRYENFLRDNSEYVNVWDTILSWDNNIIISKMKSIYDCLKNAAAKNAHIVDIMCANCGIDLYVDIVLAQFLVEKKLAKQVRFHLKAMPWFVRNATERDFHNILYFMKNQKIPVLSDQGSKWIQYLNDKKFVIAPVNYFWTSPYEYYKMVNIDTDLYNYISESALVIFKGDLHYRKLLGDRSWDATEDFITCIRGFQPTNICVMRLLKTDIICGLPYGKAEELYRINASWLVCGKYGVIHYVEKGDCKCRLSAD